MIGGQVACNDTRQITMYIVYLRIYYYYNDGNDFQTFFLFSVKCDKHKIITYIIVNNNTLPIIYNILYITLRNFSTLNLCSIYFANITTNNIITIISYRHSDRKNPVGNITVC